jgi:hypothetical protein
MMGPMVCMAKLLADVKPPIIIAAGKKQVLRTPNTMIQTRQSDNAPVV